VILEMVVVQDSMGTMTATTAMAESQALVIVESVKHGTVTAVGPNVPMRILLSVALLAQTGREAV
jgi:hypothetical protein